MNTNSSSYLLPSGQTISMEDYTALKRQIVKDTLKNVAATIGVGAVVVMINGWARGRNSESNALED